MVAGDLAATMYQKKKEKIKRVHAALTNNENPI
jgi:hypothetical protein